MITIKKIQKKELKKLVKLSYSGDSVGLNKFHVEPFTLPEAIDKTMEMITIEEQRFEFDYYKVMSDKKPVGYVVISGQILYSFGIGIEFRTKSILTLWWEEILKLLPKPFVALLYANNTRAINFLVRRGMVITGNENNLVTLINK